MNSKAVSLVELLAVLVIIGILAMISFPVVNQLIIRTQNRANQQIIESLNQATQYYKMGEGIQTSDIFLGLETNSERINRLYQKGYLTKLPQSNPPYPTFEWNIVSQTWTLVESVIEDTPVYPNYDFQTLRLIDLLSQGASIAVGNFTDTGSSYESGGGTMYIPNGYETYTLTLQAQILTSNSYGGFGIFFETTITNPTSASDSGFILQLDRGYAQGELIIRPRSNGSELSPVIRHGIRFDESGNLVSSGGLKDNTNPWWREPHTLRLQISVVSVQTQTKKVRVYLDDVFIFEYQFTSTLFGSNAENNMTGIRSWSGINIGYYQLSIAP
jgi:prepilin-type N-terminal cleavage/methylation domain-containing protein